MEDDIEIGQKLIAQREFDQARAHFRKLVARHPTEVAPLRGLLQIAKMQSDTAEVRILLDKVLALSPNSLGERALRALHRAWTNLEEARQELPDLLELALTKNLTPNAASLLIRFIQYASTEQTRLASLRQIKTRLLETAAGTDTPSVQLQVLLGELSLALFDYDDVIDTVEKLQSVNAPPPIVRRIKALARVVEKISAREYPDFRAEKVFCIGLSRTGTTSLHSALGLLGYHSAHWTNPITSDLLHQDDFYLFDAFSDISISQQFEWLYYSFPNSKFILTTRAVESWATSIARHYRQQHKVDTPQGLNTATAKQRFRNRGGQMEANLYAHHENWAEAHAVFHTRVYEFFEDKPAERFLEMDIIKGEGWEILCPFLGRPIPEREFPSLNVGVKKPAATGLTPT